MTKTKTMTEAESSYIQEKSREEGIRGLVFALAILRKTMAIENLEFGWLQDFASRDNLDPKEVVDYLWERNEFFKKQQDEIEASEAELERENPAANQAAIRLMGGTASDFMRPFRVEMCESHAQGLLESISLYQELRRRSLARGLDFEELLERSEAHFHHHLIPL